MHDADEAISLLRRFVLEQSHDAFAALVRGKIDLVHSAASRQLGGNADLAKDVTQAVFIELIKNAPRLSKATSITGWLYVSTRFAARKALRKQRRWENRQWEGHLMAEQNMPTSSELVWTEIRPVLDESMNELKKGNRDLILARFFEGKSIGQIAAQLNVSENAARMRIDRALDRLRLRLEKRGIKSTTAAVAGVLSGSAVLAAPVGLATAITGSALSSAALAGAGSLATWEVAKLLTVGKLSTTLILLGVATATISVVAARHGHSTPVAANQAQQTVPALEPHSSSARPAPPSQPGAKSAVGKAQPSGKNGPLFGFSKQMVANMHAHFMSDYAVRYAEFIKTRNLAPDKAQLFLELEADEVTILWEGHMQLGDGGGESDKDAASKAYTKDQVLIGSLLGEGGLDSLNAYNTHQVGVDTANKALDAIDPTKQIPADARASAIQVMAQFLPNEGLGDHMTDHVVIDQATKDRLVNHAEQRITAVGDQLSGVITAAQISLWQDWARGEVRTQIAFTDSVIKANQAASSAP
ncbi:MAG TPA: sigma-70 family RNA polymerase sigma factor [Opitutaceae bacterium]|jgi:RNA polymerase sigma factor (sigma-70 family)|nr:sigma-70 family RNA polymerase sigma factor [Opitutaceae bacterium]